MARSGKKPGPARNPGPGSGLEIAVLRKPGVQNRPARCRSLIRTFIFYYICFLEILKNNDLRLFQDPLLNLLSKILQVVRTISKITFSSIFLFFKGSHLFRSTHCPGKTVCSLTTLMLHNRFSKPTFY